MTNFTKELRPQTLRTNERLFKHSVLTVCELFMIGVVKKPLKLVRTGAPSYYKNKPLHTMEPKRPLLFDLRQNVEKEKITRHPAP